MRPPPLFTSVPPRLRGVPIDASADDSPQALVIRSWHEAGFRPISVNTSAELCRHPGLRPALRRLEVESLETVSGVQTASGSGLRTSLLAFLATIRSHAAAGPVAITNADIAINGLTGVAASVADVASDALLLGQRTDIADVHGDTSTLYLGGFDFFAFDPCLLDSAESLLSPALEIGLPWWDHMLPLALLAASGRPRLVAGRPFRHQCHHERWIEHDYCHVGRASTRHFAATASAGAHGPAAACWLAMYESLLDPARAVNWSDRWARHVYSWDRPPRFIAARKLQAIAAANVALLLHAAANPLWIMTAPTSSRRA